ncbi:DUF1294 domain-containing protein [Ruminococcus difficilis]|uniref:DUF1294 domain-containing protein n=1 Tax=Ruminococcus difficilis TaxID=2763069 RepID=A0A934TYS9_9FIRM|nr:DUF1294 domain-containing protein [Ruminococcus difficilis]MBK6087825.1 DUF1294 domain-containing protein [Ruminococcus difficilis]
MKFLYIYLIIINLIAVIVTIHDKRAAVKGTWRVKENTLLLISALGGSPAMYLTMLLIRHKTRKPKFMVGIPLILIVELIIIYLVLHYGYRIL